ncbi:MAG: hypothetical protein WKF84_24800 [Pyrinomonadaceae bacterium]
MASSTSAAVSGSTSLGATVDFENISDKNYRAPGWGVDGPGRSITARYQYRF